MTDRHLAPEGTQPPEEPQPSESDADRKDAQRKASVAPPTEAIILKSSD
ncbi:MAG TPA: hypothetical protein VGC45_07890 [Gryllotalpicola sp.]